MRVALGASRSAVARQLLAESLLLAAGGAVAGVLLAVWLVPVLSSQVAATPVGPVSSAVHPRMLAFTTAVAALAALACGLYPAWHASRPDLVGALKEQSAQATVGAAGRLYRLTLVAGQLALSLALIVVAGLFTRTLVNLTGSDFGFDVERLVTFRVEPGGGYDKTRTAALLDDIDDRMAAIPGVERVCRAGEPVVAGSISGGGLTVEGYTPAPGEEMRVRYNVVGPGFFDTLGVPLLAGRGITEADGPRARRVAVVNETFTRRYFPGGRALGRRISREVGNRAKLDIEIVGVARDAKYHGLREPTPEPFLYLSFAQARPPVAQFYLRTSLPPNTLLPVVRAAIAAVDPKLPIRRLKTMAQQIEDNASGERGVTRLTAAFGALATLLAGLGLYGVLAYNISCRTREIGIRIALGAAAQDVRALLGREVGILLMIGGGGGLVGAAIAGKLIEALLYQVTPWDPAIYLWSTLSLVVVAAVSAAVPARRATRVDPVFALRND